MDWSTNLQMLTTGLAIGSIYALVALGFVLIFNAVNVEGSLAPHLSNLQREKGRNRDRKPGNCRYQGDSQDAYR